MESKELNQEIKNHLQRKVTSIFAVSIVRDRYVIDRFPITSGDTLDKNNFNVDIKEHKKENLGLFGGSLDE